MILSPASSVSDHTSIDLHSYSSYWDAKTNFHTFAEHVALINH